MADTFLLEIATPNELIFSDQVEMVTAPGSEGEFGVLAGHTDFLTTLRAGLLVYKSGGSQTLLVVSGGYSEVGPEKTAVLIDSAEPIGDIDAASAGEELTSATAALEALGEDDPGLREATARCELATARVEALEHKKGH